MKTNIKFGVRSVFVLAGLLGWIPVIGGCVTKNETAMSELKSAPTGQLAAKPKVAAAVYKGNVVPVGKPDSFLGLMGGGQGGGGNLGIVRIVPSIIALAGTTVNLAMDNSDEAHLQSKANQLGVPLTLNWRKNGVEIPGATNKVYALPNVTTNDIASYTIVYKGASAGETSPVHLSVYVELFGNSNGGMLGSPIGAFISQTPGLTVSCSGATTFNRWITHTPFDTYGMSPSSPSYPNLSPDSTRLRIDTCSEANGPNLNTAIVINKNNLNTTEVGCSDDSPYCNMVNTNLSRRAVTNLQSGMSYSATIHYKNSTLTPGQDKVYFNWWYDHP